MNNENLDPREFMLGQELNSVVPEPLDSETLPPIATALEVLKSEYKLTPGQLAMITVSPIPRTSRVPDLVWTSSAPDIVEVLADGRLCAKVTGEATVSGTNPLDNSIFADIKVIVEETHESGSPEPGNILVKSVKFAAGSSYRMERSSSVKLDIEILPENATTKDLVYESSSPSVAKIDKVTGEITSVTTGNTTITATTTDGSEIKATLELSVTPILTRKLIISKEQLEIRLRDIQTLTVEVDPGDSDDKVIYWESDNTSVAAVSNEGNVAAMSVGTATITAKCMNFGNTVTAKCLVNVIEN